MKKLFLTALFVGLAVFGVTHTSVKIAQEMGPDPASVVQQVAQEMGPEPHTISNLG